MRLPEGHSDRISHGGSIETNAGIQHFLWVVDKKMFREKLADERNQLRREEKQKLFESILKMLNDLYLLFLSIKNSNDEALKVVAHVLDKVECVIPMVMWLEFHMRQTMKIWKMHPTLQ